MGQGRLRGAWIVLLIAATVSISAQTRDEIAVFDAGLKWFAADFEQRQKVVPAFLILNETVVMLPQDLGYARGDLPKPLGDSILAKNAVSESIAGYAPPQPFRLMSREAFGSVLVPPKVAGGRDHYYDWSALHSRFPDALGALELSLPAFSDDGNTALLFFWTGVSPSGGSGHLLLLTKSGGRWKVIRDFTPWVI